MELNLRKGWRYPLGGALPEEVLCHIHHVKPSSLYKLQQLREAVGTVLLVVIAATQTFPSYKRF
jgi:hypothetical protein